MQRRPDDSHATPIIAGAEVPGSVTSSPGTAGGRIAHPGGRSEDQPSHRQSIARTRATTSSFHSRPTPERAGGTTCPSRTTTGSTSSSPTWSTYSSQCAVGVQEFEQLRALLFAIAYRILGSVSEAEDAVQETWLRYQASPTQPTSTRAFLSAVVTRISIDVLRSARRRREQYVGPWLPEPLLTDPYEDPARSAELADSVSMAALLLLERLSPLERAVFVLREVFGFGFGEVASAVGRSAAACRQLAVRARRHMDALGSRPTAGSGRNWRVG